LESSTRNLRITVKGLKCADKFSAPDGT